MLQSTALTIGQISRRTGVPIKALREYERLGFLYTLGRSEGNYRLFGEEALWCVSMVQGMRSLGLTLNEIKEIVTCYVEHPGERIEPLFDTKLAQALARIETRIADLQALRQRIVDFQAARASAPPGPPTSQSSTSLVTWLLAADPRRGAAHPAP